MEVKHCTYCGKEIEVLFQPDKVVKTNIKNGVTTHWTKRETVRKYNSKKCPMCEGEFCSDCIPGSEKLCPSCRELTDKSNEIANCKHSSVDKKFIRFEEKESGDYVVYEQTCNDCGVCDLVYEKLSKNNEKPKTSSNIKKNIKLCSNLYLIVLVILLILSLFYLMSR